MIYETIITAIQEVQYWMLTKDKGKSPYLLLPLHHHQCYLGQRLTMKEVNLKLL